MNDLSICRDFVSPAYCQMLIDRKMAGCSQYNWFVNLKTMQAHLRCYPLCHGNSMQEDMNMLYIDATKVILPAYSIKELEQMLPEYTLLKRTGGYKIQLRWPLLCAEGQRLPDVIAAILIKLIDGGYSQVPNLNYILSCSKI
jgi:hypothetical protein